MNDLIGWVIAIIVVLVVTGVYVGVKYFTTEEGEEFDLEEEIQKVREWVLAQVIDAEKYFGSDTGVYKLRYVYDIFVSKFSWLVALVSFETFSDLVDDALIDMKSILSTNQKMYEYVYGATEDEEETLDEVTEEITEETAEDKEVITEDKEVITETIKDEQESEEV